MVQPSAWTRCCPARPGRPSSPVGPARPLHVRVIPLALWSAPIDFPRATPQPAVDGPLAGWPRVPTRIERFVGRMANGPSRGCVARGREPRARTPIRSLPLASCLPTFAPQPAALTADAPGAPTNDAATTRDTRPAHHHSTCCPTEEGMPHRAHRSHQAKHGPHQVHPVDGTRVMGRARQARREGRGDRGMWAW